MKFSKIFPLLMLALVAILTTIGYLANRAKTSEKPRAARQIQKPQLDMSAQEACYEFGKFLQDVQKGILTDSEIRDRIKKIRGYCQDSDLKRIQAAGDALLRGATIGTTSELVLAIKQMADACTKP